MGFGDEFNYYEYHSDDGNTYNVKLSLLIGAAGGFNVATSPLSNPGYPYNPGNMRHLWGVSSEGKRSRLPVANSLSSLFVEGGSWSMHGQTYVSQGAIGERRVASAIGG